MRVITAQRLARSRDIAPCTRCTHSLRLCFAGICAEVRSCEAPLIGELRRRYRYHVSAAPTAFVYTICASPEGYALSRERDGWLWNDGALPAGALAFLADAALLSAVVHADPALQSVHAAAIAYNQRGAIIAGDSEAGKTTTLLGCAREGLQLFSDERALVRGGTLYPFVRRCRVRTGGRSLLLADNPGDAVATHLQESEEIDLTECFGNESIGEPAPLRAVFILHGRAARAAIERIDSAAALPAISRWFDMRGEPLDRLGEALALLRGRDCYRLTAGTPADTARLIRTALEVTA